MKEESVKIKHKSQRKPFTRKMQTRLLAVFFFVVGLLIIIIIRLGCLAAMDKYKKKALKMRSYITTEVPSKRGDILDRNGQVLASSEMYFNLIIDPSIITSGNKSYIEPTRDALVAVYGIDKDVIQKIIDENNKEGMEDKDKLKYKILKTNLTYDEKVAFQEYTDSREDGYLIKGVRFEQNYKRVYPFGNLASQLIGFTVKGEGGNYGIEQYYDDILCGHNGKAYGYYDSELNIVETVNKAENGKNIVTTIDINVQRVLQNVIEQFLTEHGAKNAGALVMDADTGEVLGMASNYSFDLNNPRDLSKYFSDEEIKGMSDQEMTNELYKIWRNFCISDAYEPGSIYKPFTVAAALEENIISTGDRFLCDGHEDFPGDIKIKCSNKKGHGDISVAQSIMLSCNDALMQIAAKEGAAVFHAYQEDYCIGAKTGIDLPGEATGKIYTENELRATELATSSFGQGFTTTMIQMASSFCALINGGTYYEPHVVKRIENAQGATTEKFDSVVVNKTTSEKTSEFLKESLYLTVSEGTGKKANLDGYVIGGKTGTSQKHPLEEEKYVLSFLGFVESEEKCYIIYVVIDECLDPELASLSATAMDVFKDIAERSLPYLKVYPEGDIDYHIDIITDADIMFSEESLYDPSQDEASPNVLGE